jgi:hypothetical protein
VFNPAQKLDGKAIRNPAVEFAKTQGIDLAGDLTVLADTEEGAPEFRETEQRLIELVPDFRRHIKASSAISDQDMLCAICHYDRPVTIEPALGALPEVEQLRAMRDSLKPHINQCCTDEDLLAAVQNPNGPLLAAGLCQVQTLHRNTRAPICSALAFSPEVLARDRVRARLWYDTWQSLDGDALGSAVLTSAA